MTREKALQVCNLLAKIETYEALIDEITGLQTLEEIERAYGDTIREELIDVINLKLDVLTNRLEEQ